MQIIVDGMLTHYERRGSGPVILILPGWADTSKSWLTVQKILSADFDVVVLDIPGFGGTQSPESAWNLDDYSKFISHFVDKVELQKLHAVIGHSNGGAMAIRSVKTSRLNAEKIVLVASAGIRTMQKGRKKVLKLVAKTGKILAKPLPRSMQTKLRSRLYTSIGSDMLVAEHMQETFKNIVADDIQTEAAQIHLPTLLIYGDQDTETPVKFGEMLHKLISKSDLQVVSGADHFIHVHQPELVGEKIRKFLG